MRLPQTPEEWAEVEHQASKGPSAVYAWVYGQSSQVAEKTASLTWEDVDEADPIAGCHKIIDVLRELQEN